MPHKLYDLTHVHLDKDDDDIRSIALPSNAFDVLLQLAETGPVWDGDVVSKSGRDDLLDHGLAVKILWQGDDGFQAATYKARRWYMAYFSKEFPTQLKVRDVAMARKIKQLGS